MNHIFLLSVEDAQIMAEERYGRELDEEELEFVKKGVEWGLECWAEVMGYAMDGLEEEPSIFKGTLLANNPHGLN